MYEKFTDRARRIMQLANQEAQRFNHEYIGTEHILLGLLKESAGVAVSVLKNLGVDLRKIRLEIEKIVQSGPDMVTMGKLPQTPRAKKVIEYAIEEARNLSHNCVDTEHLLLGLIRETEGLAAQVLLNLGLNLTLIRAAVLEELGHNTDINKKPVSASEGQSRSKTPALDSFGRDLTELARQNKLTKLVGRSNELDQVLLVMTCRHRNNPLLLGEPGVGKRTLVEGLARRTMENNWPQVLRDRRIVALNLARMALRTLEGNQFDAALKAVFNEMRRARNIILFLEDYSTWVSARASVGGLYVVSLLNSALTAGDVQCIGAASVATHHTQLDRPPEDQFQPIFVRQPSQQETLEILRGLCTSYENYHGIKISDDAVEASIELSEQHIPGRALSAKAIQLLDQAGAMLRLVQAPPPPEIREVEAQINQRNLQKESAVAEQDFQKAAELRDQTDQLKDQLQKLIRDWHESMPDVYGVVDRATVAEVVEKMYPR